MEDRQENIRELIKLIMEEDEILKPYIELNETLERFTECFNENNIPGMFTSLSDIGEQIQPLCKELAPEIAKISTNYRIALKPVADQLVVELITLI